MQLHKLNIKFIPFPGHWPRRYNGSTEPCDMLLGPCSCGGWHRLDNDPTTIDIIAYGLKNYGTSKQAMINYQLAGSKAR